MNEEQKHAIMTSLVQMVRADGKVVAEEQKLLKRLLKQLGSDGAHLEAVPTGGDIPRLHDLLPAHADRLQVIKQLMSLSMCDGNISFTEFAYLSTMAERLEVTPQELERLRDEVLAQV